MSRDMTTFATKVSKANRAIKNVLRATFPTFKGGTVKIILTENLPHSYADGRWSEGSRRTGLFYSTRSANVVYLDAHDGNGHHVEAPHWIIVEHDVFCGKDCGITIRMQRVLNQADEDVIVDILLADPDNKFPQHQVAKLVPAESWAVGVGTLRDLAWAHIEGRVAALRRGERAAARALDQAERRERWVTA